MTALVVASCLLDTNILLRLLDSESPLSDVAAAAISLLALEGASLYITAQNLIEFWAVATRPIEHNGLGLSIPQARAKVEEFKRLFYLAPDAPGILEEWERIVLSCEVSGKQVHDARLAAVAVTHRIETVLTFNESDFRRFARLGLAVLTPSEVIAGASADH